MLDCVIHTCPFYQPFFLFLGVWPIRTIVRNFRSNWSYCLTDILCHRWQNRLLPIFENSVINEARWRFYVYFYIAWFWISFLRILYCPTYFYFFNVSWLLRCFGFSYYFGQIWVVVVLSQSHISIDLFQICFIPGRYLNGGIGMAWNYASENHILFIF